MQRQDAGASAASSSAWGGDIEEDEEDIEEDEEDIEDDVAFHTLHLSSLRTTSAKAEFVRQFRAAREEQGVPCYGTTGYLPSAQHTYAMNTRQQSITWTESRNRSSVGLPGGVTNHLKHTRNCRRGGPPLCTSHHTKPPLHTPFLNCTRVSASALPPPLTLSSRAPPHRPPPPPLA